MSDETVSPLALRLVAANARVNAAAIVAALALIVLGVWMHAGLTRS